MVVVTKRGHTGIIPVDVSAKELFAQIALGLIREYFFSAVFYKTSWRYDHFVHKGNVWAMNKSHARTMIQQRVEQMCTSDPNCSWYKDDCILLHNKIDIYTTRRKCPKEKSTG